MALTRKVQKGSNGQTLVTIPSDFAELMELEQGTELEFQVENSETLKLKKKS